MVMIEWDWYSQLTEEQDQELRQVLLAAEDYDMEQGFSVVDYQAVKADLKDQSDSNKLMLVYYLPSDQAERSQNNAERTLAAVLRAEIADDGSARIGYTVNPELRSLGITTLLVEETGLPGQPHNAWQEVGITKISTWARGDHPAAERLTTRFGIPATQSIWRLFRELKDPVRELPEHDFNIAVVNTGADEIGQYEGAVESTPRPATGLALDVTRSDRRVLLAKDSSDNIAGAASFDLKTTFDLTIGRWADIEYASTCPDAEERLIMWLLGAVIEEAQEQPMDSLVLHLEPEDEDLVQAVRLHGFVHDRTDVAYSI